MQKYKISKLLFGLIDKVRLLQYGLLLFMIMKLDYSRDIWITSDTHFGHANIAGPSVSNWSGGYRNFDSVHDMNRTLVDSINQVVGQDDILFHLGDWCFGGHRNTPKYREWITCREIHVLRGNHDKHIDKYKECFASINDVLTLNLPDGLEIFMSHYAHRVWHHSHKGVLHLYGHSHGNLEHIKWGKSMDVGVDNHYRLFGNWRPFSLLKEIRPNMNKRQILEVDHYASN